MEQKCNKKKSRILNTFSLDKLRIRVQVLLVFLSNFNEFPPKHLIIIRSFMDSDPVRNLIIFIMKFFILTFIVIHPNATTQQDKTSPPVVLWTPCSRQSEESTAVTLLPSIGTYRQGNKTGATMAPAYLWLHRFIASGVKSVEQPSLPVETSISQGTAADVCLWVTVCVWSSSWAAQLHAGLEAVVRMNSSQTSAAPTRMAGPSQYKRNMKSSNSWPAISWIDFLRFPVLSAVPISGDPQEQTQIIKCKASKKSPLQVIPERMFKKYCFNGSFTQMNIFLWPFLITMKRNLWNLKKSHFLCFFFFIRLPVCVLQDMGRPPWHQGTVQVWHQQLSSLQPWGGTVHGWILTLEGSCRRNLPGLLN